MKKLTKQSISKLILFILNILFINIFILSNYNILHADTIEHNYETTYVFSNDYKQITFTSICSGCKDKIVETLDTSFFDAEPATCDTPTKGYYFILYREKLYKSPVIELENSILGHDYEFTYVWSKDHKYCTATRICHNDPFDIVTETKESTYKRTSNVSLLQNEIREYTVVFDNNIFNTQKESDDVISSRILLFVLIILVILIILTVPILFKINNNRIRNHKRPLFFKKQRRHR